MLLIQTCTLAIRSRVNYVTGTLCLQGVTATPWEKNPRTLSLMEELQGEISRRQVAELAACEARAAAGQLLDKIANAHEEQMSSRKSMLDAEQRFQRERRAWEYDSMDMAARAQQTADEMASVCEALQKGKERIAALEEELASETAVKERAMAFITQRALITSREEVRTTRFASGLDDQNLCPMDTTLRHSSIHLHQLMAKILLTCLLTGAAN